MNERIATTSFALIVFSQGLAAQDILCAWPGLPQSGLADAIDSAGDVDMDGVSDVIIGDDFYYATPSLAGRVEVRSGGDCSKSLHVLHGVSYQEAFGWSVAGVGDVDGDGHSDFLIGVPLRSVASPAAGECFLHSGKDGSVLWSAVGGPGLHGFVGDRLGFSVAGVGDTDLDGFPDWAVSSFTEPVGAGFGVVRIHTGLTGTNPIKLIDGNQTEFGAFVAGTGDATGDGRADVVVGSIGHAGRVTLFSGADGSIVWGVSGTDPTGSFGFAVDGAGDVDGDGLGDVVAGGHQVDGPFVNSGRVAVFTGPTGSVLFDTFGESGGAMLGLDVAGVGDVNGDGREEIAYCSFEDPGFRVLSVLEPKTLTVVPEAQVAVARGGDLDGDGVLDIIGSVDPVEVRTYSGACPAVAPFGSGCPGTAGIAPTIDTDLGSCVLNPGDPLTLTIAGGVGGETAFLLFGAAKASIPTGACTLLVAPLVGPMLPIPLGGAGAGNGTANLTAVVPAAAAGATIRMQAFLTDPIAAFGYTTTNGLELRVE